MSFSQKLISVQLDLANGQFAGGGNSAMLTGLRISVRINVPGGASLNTLDGAIYGMSLSQMNQLSTVGTQFNKRLNNKITVMAGDAQQGMALVYKGSLLFAYTDAQSMPEVCFRVQGMEGIYESVKPVKALSVQGSGDVAQMMQTIAGSMNYQLENSGVNGKIANPYYWGSARMQALHLAQHAGIEHVLDKGTLAIWPAGQARQGSTPLISPQTGMVGYPLLNQNNVVVKTVFDPTIKFGGYMQIQSDITPACGTWKINNVVHELDALTPHGRWFTSLSGVIQSIDP